MKRFIFFWFLGVIFLFPGYAFSEKLTLDDFVESAVENNPRLSEVKESASAASGEKAESFGKFFPSLSASFRASYTDTVPKMDFMMPVMADPDTGQLFYEKMSVEMGQEDSYSAQVQIRQPLFTFGSIRSAYRISSNVYDIRSSGVNRQKDELRGKIKKSYYRVLFLDELLAIAREQKSLMEENLNTTRALYKSGKVSILDVNRVRSHLLRAESGLAEAETSLKQARAVLFSEAVIEDRGQKIEGKLGPREFDVKLADILKLSFRRREELEIAEMNIDIAENRKKIELAENLPKLFGFASYNFEQPYQMREEWGQSWVAGGVLEFPLPGASMPGKIRRLNAQVKQAQAARENLIRGIELEVRNNFHSVSRSNEAIAIMEENLQITSGSLDTAKRQYEKGQISNVELNEAILDYTLARREYAAAVFDFLVGLEDLKLSAGGKLSRGNYE